MIKVIFKNLEKSELAKDLAIERILAIVERFADLRDHRISVTLSMQNSPVQAGPDLFTVKVLVDGNRYKTLVVEKSAQSLYVALADVAEHLLERFNRYGDKTRVRRRQRARELKSQKISEVKNATYSA